MSEALGLVNARSAIILGKSRFSGNAQIPAQKTRPRPKAAVAAGKLWRQSGRTVALTLKLAAANGCTRARSSWA
jgi:hypothetical protein